MKQLYAQTHILSTSDIRRLGYKGKLPKREEHHPEVYLTTKDGKQYRIAAPRYYPGCGRTLFYHLWRVN
jgi:hypothetical protein